MSHPRLGSLKSEGLCDDFTTTASKHRSGCAHLDRVSKRRPRPVHLELPDATSLRAGNTQSLRDKGLLRWAIGGCQRARPAVLVHCTSNQKGSSPRNVLTRRLTLGAVACVYHTAAFSSPVPIRSSIQCLAPPIHGEHARRRER